MSETSITNLLRQYCDGELNDEQAAQVEQHLQDHPEDKAIVESQRMLRKRIEAVVKADCPSAPAGLADQIKAEFAKYEGEPTAYSPKPGIWATNKSNIFAAAASIVLVIGAVLFGIFGRPIDTPNVVINQAAEAAESVGLEHINVATNKILLEDMNTKGCNSCASARSACRKELGTNKIPEINLTSAGYDFKGGMVCKVPHCETSYHLFFKNMDSGGLVSIHIVKDTGKLNLDNGFPFESKMELKTSRFYMDKSIMDGKPSVVAFSDGEAIYMVMTCISSDTEQVIGTIQDSILSQEP